MSAFDPQGPAVSLGNSASIFPRWLAKEWSDRGIPSTIVTSTTESSEPQEGVSLLSSQGFESLSTKIVRKLSNPLLRRLERKLPQWQLKRYFRRTGRQQPDFWEWYWVDHFWDSFSRAKAALSLRPRFVFAHEASSYGLSAALCHGVPRIIFPWGGDVFNCVESSVVIDWMTTYALKNVDLIIPSSVVAAQHIRERFHLSEKKVQALSWGVDLEEFSRASSENRVRLCRELAIDPSSILILNCRRFRPHWGSSKALEAFLKVAHRTVGTHFLLLTGSGTEELVQQAKRQVASCGMGSRFTFLEGNIPLSRCAEMMSIADVFVSLVGRGDMRSGSVTQATACGGAPVILESAEYREMEKQGFACEFVQPGDGESLVATLQRLAADENQRQFMRTQNQHYLREYENYDKQMARMLDLIAEASHGYTLSRGK
jgi:glycosyltransferase involved in cell wall biosynthesis